MHSTPNHFIAVIAFLLPPAAVWIETGWCSADGGINLLLCLLGWIPGIVHAMYIVYRKKPYCVEDAHPTGAACCCAQHHYAPRCSHHHHHHVAHSCHHAPIEQQPALQRPLQQRISAYDATHQPRPLPNRDSDSTDTAVERPDERVEILPEYKV